MATWIVLSGDAWLVEADSELEAEIKYEAMNSGEPCPCGESFDDCECFEEGEADTVVMPA
jgi:hypothetical protein